MHIDDIQGPMKMGVLSRPWGAPTDPQPWGVLTHSNPPPPPSPTKLTLIGVYVYFVNIMILFS